MTCEQEPTDHLTRFPMRQIGDIDPSQQGRRIDKDSSHPHRPIRAIDRRGASTTHKNGRAIGPKQLEFPPLAGQACKRRFSCSVVQTCLSRDLPPFSHRHDGPLSVHVPRGGYNPWDAFQAFPRRLSFYRGPCCQYFRMCDYTKVTYQCGHIRYLVKAW